MRTMRGLAVLSMATVFSCGGQSFDAVTGGDAAGSGSGGASGSVDTSSGSGVANAGASVANAGASVANAGASVASGGTSGAASGSGGSAVAGSGVVLDLNGSGGSQPGDNNGGGSQPSNSNCAWVLTGPPSPLISDFPLGMPPASNFAGVHQLWGPGAGPGSVTAVAPGEMHAQSTGSMAVAYAYLIPLPPGLPASLEPRLCVDVSKYFTGFKFKIRSPSNTSLVFDVLTPETESLGRCRKQITVSPVNAAVTVAFSDLVVPKGVNPTTGMVLPVGYNPGAHVAAIRFLATGEDLDIYVDDVTFY